MVHRTLKVKKSGKQKKLRDHYVPEFYLNEFCIPNISKNEKPSVWMYDIENPIPKKIATEKIAKIKNFYEQEVDDVLTDLEGKIAPIFRRLRSTEIDLTNIQVRYTLGKFICFLAFRTPQFREHYDTLVQNTLKSKLVKQFNQKGITAVIDEFNKRTIYKVTSEEFIDSFNKIKIKAPVGSFPEILGGSVERMIPAFCSMKWHFLKPDPEYCFITSDAPVVMNDPNERDPSIRYGYGRKSIRIIFPINRRLCLLASWSGIEGYYFVNVDVVNEMNSKIAEHARRYIFSPVRYKIDVIEGL
jgi:hypothetical protein